MKTLSVVLVLLMASSAWALDVVYLVTPKEVVVEKTVGTSCLAAQNGASADLQSPHVRIPVTVANPQQATFFPTRLKLVVFAKGEIQECDFKDEELASLGFPSFGVPHGYQATTACELTCGGLKISEGKKAFAIVEVYGYLKLPLDNNKAVFQETSLEINNPVSEVP